MVQSARKISSAKITANFKKANIVSFPVNKVITALEAEHIDGPSFFEQIEDLSAEAQSLINALVDKQSSVMSDFKNPQGDALILLLPNVKSFEQKMQKELAQLTLVARDFAQIVHFNAQQKLMGKEEDTSFGALKNEVDLDNAFHEFIQKRKDDYAAYTALEEKYLNQISKEKNPSKRKKLRNELHKELDTVLEFLLEKRMEQIHALVASEVNRLNKSADLPSALKEELHKEYAQLDKHLKRFTKKLLRLLLKKSKSAATDIIESTNYFLAVISSEEKKLSQRIENAFKNVDISETKELIRKKYAYFSEGITRLRNAKKELLGLGTSFSVLTHTYEKIIYFHSVLRQEHNKSESVIKWVREAGTSNPTAVVTYCEQYYQQLNITLTQAKRTVDLAARILEQNKDSSFTIHTLALWGKKYLKDDLSSSLNKRTKDRVEHFATAVFRIGEEYFSLNAKIKKNNPYLDMLIHAASIEKMRQELLHYVSPFKVIN